MSTNPLLRINGALVAAAVLALLPAWSTSQAETKTNGSDESVVVPVEGDKEFRQASPWLEVPEDGWPKFVHAGETFKFGAPTPAVPLRDVEWKQWRNDLVSFKFDKLRDRQLLYVYYLWPPEAEQATAKKHAKSVLDAIRAVKVVPTAIGVEYDTGGKELLRGAELYRLAAVPVMWTDVMYKFIETEHDPVTFATLVQATATALLKGAYANFEAVEKWSALAKQAGLDSAYMKTVSKGPLNWQELEPVASFIAVDRKLDIEEIEAEPVLTSKAAWGTADK